MGEDQPEPLNPIFEYAAKGQYHGRRVQWESAVHWYHRALACLPNLFGSDKKLRSLHLPEHGGVAFNPQHAGRLYAALGNALMAMGLREDSILAFQAAMALDPDNIAAAQNLGMGTPSPVLDAGAAMPARMRAEPGTGRNRADAALKEDLTLIMATHCTQRLKKFAPLSPPSNNLLTATYGSLLNMFGEGIAACPKIICYDANPKGSACDIQYGRSVEAFSRRNGFLLRRFQGAGLFNVLNRTIRTVTTPYIFFVEHDWMFKDERIQLTRIIEMMSDDPNINTIRFNKRENCLNGQDFLMRVDPADREYPLLQTSSYSNNPSIIRTEKLKNEWLPICDKALRLVKDQLGGRAFGIEEILFRKYCQDIRTYGFIKAHAGWGAYVFGGVGDPPRIVHLGE